MQSFLLQKVANIYANSANTACQQKTDLNPLVTNKQPVSLTRVVCKQLKFQRTFTCCELLWI